MNLVRTPKSDVYDARRRQLPDTTIRNTAALNIDQALSLTPTFEMLLHEVEDAGHSMAMQTMRTLPLRRGAYENVATHFRGSTGRPTSMARSEKFFETERPHKL
eukprot:5472546-Pleurochrysis_carterae.AAC.4